MRLVRQRTRHEDERLEAPVAPAAENDTRPPPVH